MDRTNKSGSYFIIGALGLYYSSFDWTSANRNLHLGTGSEAFWRKGTHIWEWFRPLGSRGSAASLERGGIGQRLLWVKRLTTNPTLQAFDHSIGFQRARKQPHHEGGDGAKDRTNSLYDPFNHFLDIWIHLCDSSTWVTRDKIAARIHQLLHDIHERRLAEYDTEPDPGLFQRKEDYENFEVDAVPWGRDGGRRFKVPRLKSGTLPRDIHDQETPGPYIETGFRVLAPNDVEVLYFLSVILKMKGVKTYEIE
ncbi:uncharacterized protein CLAFUR5_09354 [Fulvia fulva]|uniref:Uncharacterized protein n=1 Tax=Passalora fulva TaxID=5499 RepID=A0A9Q8UTU7_PASFU|nr:uncharacterized protein CLAFUR5_09354 [Fulvia fulva]UJO22152.1 hypothetical protein CLAFUR5_09354 [Fulvia fulva]